MVNREKLLVDIAKSLDIDPDEVIKSQEELMNEQALQQAITDSAAAAAREAQFEPFTRLGLVGQQLAQIQPGAFPTQTVGYQAPGAGPSPLQTALGVGTGLASIGSKLGIFG